MCTTIEIPLDYAERTSLAGAAGTPGARCAVGQEAGEDVVEVNWNAWEGGGESGRVPGLVTVDEVDVVVDEIQAVVVNSR